MRNLLKTFLVSVLALSGSYFFASCGGGNKTETAQSELDTSAGTDAQVLEVVENLFSKLPKPSSIPNLIYMTGAEYEAKMLLPAQGLDKLAATGTNADAACALGMLLSDIGYMAAYEKGHEATRFFVMGKKLADKAGISNSIDQELITKMENNIALKDSLIRLTDLTLARSSEMLKKNDQIKDAALLTAGGLIEGIYLTCGLIHDYPPTGMPKAEQDKILVPLVNTVIRQEDAIADVTELLRKVNEPQADERVTSLISRLEAIQGIYTQANWKERLAKNDGSLVPTEKDIDALSRSISELRNSLIP
jgi:hypothetical protein